MFEYASIESLDFSSITDFAKECTKEGYRLHTAYTVPVRGSASVDTVRHYAIFERFVENEESDTEDTAKGIAMVG